MADAENVEAHNCRAWRLENALRQRTIRNTHTSSITPTRDRSGKLLVMDEEQIEKWVADFKEVLNQPGPSDTYDSRIEEEESVLKISIGYKTLEQTDRVIKV